MITKYSDLKNKFKRLKSNQSYIIFKGMENEDIKRKYLESIQLIIKGIKLAEELNDLELLIILKKKLASIYISIERYKEAIEVLEQIKQLKVNLNILDANKNYKVLYEQNKLIYEIGQKIMLNLNEDNIFNVISKEIMRVIRCDSIEILTYNEKREAFQYQGVIKEGKIIDLDNVNLYENKFVIYSIKHKKDLIINDIKKDGYKYIKNYDKYLGEINLKKNKANSLMVVPMIIKDKVKGALSLQCYEKNSYDLKDLTTLKMLSTYIAIALENYFLYKKLKYNSNYDSLTGIFNRGKVIENINLLKQNLDFNKEKYYIAMIDIDNFKKVNDIYGHIAGDKVLKEVSNIIRKSISNEDILGRYGGEEFIAIIKDEINNYKEIIERIRRNIEELNINVNNKLIKVNSSIGVKNFNLNKMTLEENISLADKSLYEAKNSGKNRVVY